MWVGPGQSFLTFPVSAGKMLNLVAFVPTNLDVEESWSAPGDVAALAAAYNRWNKQVRQIIEATDHTFRWGIYDRAPLKIWSTDRITLLGNAAHAVTPHLDRGPTRRSRTQSPSPCCSKTHKPPTFHYGCAVTRTYVPNASSGT